MSGWGDGGGGVEGIRRLIRQKELVSWDRAN